MIKKGDNKFNQYFTNNNIATFMSSLFTISHEQSEICILDPGAGEGNLTFSTVKFIVTNFSNVRKISIIAYEIDEQLSYKLKLRFKEMKQDIKELFEVKLDFKIVVKNYLYCSGDKINADIAIVNPPYGKISRSSNISINLQASGHSNINYYSSFIEIAMSHLKEGGQLVSIIPRSFMNGIYFKNFRKNIFQRNSIVRIHVFESRYLFDKVIQENVILKLNKERQKNNVYIDVSYSTDDSFDDMAIVSSLRSDLVDEENNYLMKVSSNEVELEIRKIIERNGISLKDLGELKVSTGPVVDFREEPDSISKKRDKEAVPYIFQDHIRENENIVVWPLEYPKKGNYLKVTEKNCSRLRKAGNYVVVRRFSPKESRHRVNAVVVPNNLSFEYYAFDNKINYFHINKEGLPENMALGLSLYLNSSLVEIFIKQISGSTQLNKSDLALLKYPELQQMEEMGALWKSGAYEYNQLNINKVVASAILHWEK